MGWLDGEAIVDCQRCGARHRLAALLVSATEVCGVIDTNGQVCPGARFSITTPGGASRAFTVEALANTVLV